MTITLTILCVVSVFAAIICVSFVVLAIGLCVVGGAADGREEELEEVTE